MECLAETKSTQENIRDHIVEMGAAGRLMRSRAVEEQIKDIEQELRERRERLNVQEEGVGKKLNEKSILALIAQRKKLLREFDYALSCLIMTATKTDNSGVSREEIDRARTYPIESLIEVRRDKMARCVSGQHSDNSPSMDTRNNFCYCYSCGWTGDVITVYQKLYGVTFPEAVRALQ